ncbi:hypothetical protein BKA67DRAFT_637196 [Truncatella angustata]|uniref:NmrA-like domain-containing protein n=1 Tax=Truncatella angustata TaxID=152316 RepID=A0A9P8ZXA6_9PEZI|nr:uncharacterized protein BKA67DRAFT_637196 [Truncatella angustata]KAH6652893.1 hypothetical protein BKA67DRAFT_637196 [Truncatella angustata]
MAPRIICVVGATGNQGGSVGRRFAQDDRFKVRALTRNTASPSAQKLASEYPGIELITADLEDVKSLEIAFKGANVIFSVTDYWEPFFRPDCRQEAHEIGISCRKYAYDVEYRHGKNIADAAATTVRTLDENGFLVSTLSHARKCSGGEYKQLYHFDAKADVFPDYVKERYPALARKMSCIQTGYFMTSYRILPDSYLAKQSDGSFQTRFPTTPDKPTFHLDVNADTGNFVYAVAQMPAGNHYMACGTTCTWSEYMRLWSKVTGMSGTYKQVTPQQMIDVTPDKPCGEEVADMWSYTSNPGYDGGMELLFADDVRKAGIDCPMTTLEEWMANHDWSAVLNK